MGYYTHEQLLRLQEIAADHFATVIRHQYKRNDTRAVCQEVLDIYEAATGPYSGSKDWNCATCQYKLFEKAGRLYYDSIAYWDGMDVSTNEVDDIKILPVSPPKSASKQSASKPKKNATQAKKTSKNKA